MTILNRGIVVHLVLITLFVFLFCAVINSVYALPLSDDTDAPEESHPVDDGETVEEKSPVLMVHYEPHKIPPKTRKISRTKRAVTAIKERRWPNATIPYVINANITDGIEQNIMAAIAHWEKHTCIRFVIRTDEADYIEFAPGQCGCCSFVGRQGKGRQYVNLTPYCGVYGVAVHEIGHSIGFWHEHSRPDRDKYVRILVENIKQERMENFQKKGPSDIDSLGQPYDYGSIMHYRRTTFSSNEKDTMVPLQEDVVIGQREALSPGDIIQANLLYNCPKPRCDKVYDGNSGNISTPNFPMYYYNAHSCTWIINTDKDKLVQITFDKFEVEATDNCTFDYLEIRRFDEDGPLIGRLCGMGEPGELIVKGPLWMKFVSDISVTMMGFKGRYQVVRKEDLERADLQHDEFNESGVEENATSALSDSLELDNNIVAYKTDCDRVYDNVMGTIANPLMLAMSGINVDCRWNIDGGDTAKGIQLTLDARITRRHEVKCLGDIYIKRKSTKHDNTIDSGGYTEYEYDCTNLTKRSFVLDTDQALIIWSSTRHAAFSMDYLIDYDECASNLSQCEQLCINQIQGYECRCRPGYILEQNGKNCRPKLAQSTDLCNSRLSSTRGKITGIIQETPHDCYFEIEQPLGYRVHLVFTEMNIPQSENCTSDYVEVTKGQTEADNKGVFCGTNLPSPISASNGYLNIRLHIESETLPNPGQPYFVASFVAHKSPDGDRCFERLRGSGNLSSPNHPGKYPHNTTCIYKLSVPPPYKIKLTFHAMDIEVTKRCMFDHVVVKNGRNRASPLIGRYCGKKIPDEIISKGRHLWLMFISDDDHNGRGFSASFLTVRPDGSVVTDADLTTPSPQTTSPPPTTTTLPPTTSQPTRKRKRKKGNETRSNRNRNNVHTTTEPTMTSQTTMMSPTGTTSEPVTSQTKTTSEAISKPETMTSEMSPTSLPDVTKTSPSEPLDDDVDKKLEMG